DRCVLRLSAKPAADDRVDDMSRPANRLLRRASRRKRPPEVHRARGPKAPLPKPRQQLSRREREIVALLIAGRSVKEAAGPARPQPADRRGLPCAPQAPLPPAAPVVTGCASGEAWPRPLALATPGKYGLANGNAVTTLRAPFAFDICASDER